MTPLDYQYACPIDQSLTVERLEGRRSVWGRWHSDGQRSDLDSNRHCFHWNQAENPRRTIARFNQHHFVDHFTLWQFLKWMQRNSECRVLCTWGWFSIHSIRPSTLALFCLHHNRTCSGLLRSVSHSFPMLVTAQLRLELCCCTKILAKMAGKKTVGGGVRTSASACLNSCHEIHWDANDLSISEIHSSWVKS